jgi:Uma2 family endonuclease
MNPNLPKAIIEVEYEAAAQEYLRSLPLEHFMEATAQATQRKITLESLDLVRGRRPDVQVFNELLVQYPKPRSRKPGQVVPDNMVVLSDEPVRATTSFNTPLESAKPFWMLEYVSKNTRRKDYDDNFDKYERDLKVPYYLLFYPETQDLTLYRYAGKKYQSVPPNEDGRHPLPELELEVGLLDGWVRFWFEGKLLPLPAELQQDLDEARREAKRQKRRADEQQRRADEQQRRADGLQSRLEEAERALARLQAQSGSERKPPG